mmetsp:Transcript_22545/g.62287  ORF Transcript_22545/g.62287 Transcript_22545/m.62287 type:complete len:298 (+) Transcript_22545:529-1422(+)
MRRMRTCPPPRATCRGSQTRTWQTTAALLSPIPTQPPRWRPRAPLSPRSPHSSPPPCSSSTSSSSSNPRVDLPSTPTPKPLWGLVVALQWYAKSHRPSPLSKLLMSPLQCLCSRPPAYPPPPPPPPTPQKTMSTCIHMLHTPLWCIKEGVAVGVAVGRARPSAKRARHSQKGRAGTRPRCATIAAPLTRRSGAKRQACSCAMRAASTSRTMATTGPWSSCARACGESRLLPMPPPLLDLPLCLGACSLRTRAIHQKRGARLVECMETQPHHHPTEGGAAVMRDRWPPPTHHPPRFWT